MARSFTLIGGEDPPRHRQYHRPCGTRKLQEISTFDHNGHRYRERFFRAAAAPFLPNAVRTPDDRCAIVRFFLAAAAAFLIFVRAPARCFLVATVILSIATLLLLHRLCFFSGFTLWSLRRDLHRELGECLLIPIHMGSFLFAHFADRL